MESESAFPSDEKDVESMNEDGLSGTALIALKHETGIFLAIDGLIGDDEGYTENVKGLKIGVLSDPPHLVHCLLAGNRSRCLRTVAETFESDLNGRRMSVMELASHICTLWSPISIKEESKQATIVIGAYDNGLMQLYAVELTLNGSSYYPINENTFFAGNGGSKAKPIVEHDYTFTLDAREVCKLIKKGMDVASKPYEKNGKMVQRTGGQINVLRILPNNTKETLVKKDIDEIREQLKL